MILSVSGGERAVEINGSEGRASSLSSANALPPVPRHFAGRPAQTCGWLCAATGSPKETPGTPTLEKQSGKDDASVAEKVRHGRVPSPT